MLMVNVVINGNEINIFICYVCLYVCIWMCIFGCLYVYIYINIYVYVYIYIICIYIYTYINSRRFPLLRGSVSITKSIHLENKKPNHILSQTFYVYSKRDI